MQYHALHDEFQRLVNYTDDVIECSHGLCVRNFDFQSRIRYDFPGRVDTDGIFAAYPDASEKDRENIIRLISVKDADITENLRFRYHLLMRRGQERADNVICMFHGFNEKQWSKYLPWAAHLAVKTGYAILLFPIAFHMNRAPANWTDIRSMNRISKIRRIIYDSIIDSSLSNVAISTRLHHRPDRFIWSGLESYYDVMDLVDAIRADRHPGVLPQAGIHFFSYSVGSFLGQTIMMTNRNGLFSTSKYAIFCGGPVFNRLSPVSRFILDSEASVKLYSYLVEHLESHMRDNPELQGILNGAIPEGRNFRALLSYRDSLAYREDKFREIADRLYAIALGQDEVVPSYEVINTLRGSRQDIGIPVDVMDFPYAYRHEDPFPKSGASAEEVDRAFQKTFTMFANFFC